jgi:hypothetical protein
LKAVAGKKGKDDDGDDPIAQHLALRLKAGSLTSVISAADAKKMGLVTKTPVETKPPKPAAGKVVAPKVPANKENQETENKKTPAAKTSFKVAATAATAFPGKKGAAADDDDDPIDASLKERMKAGSLNSVVPADKKASAKLIASKPASMAIKPKEEKKVEEKKQAAEKSKAPEPVAKKEVKEKK